MDLGYSLDDKRNQLYDSTFAGDLPEVLVGYKNRDAEKDTDRTVKAFFVPVDEIRENKYDLSLNRYKEEVYEEVVYEEPQVILGKLRDLEQEILRDLDELEGML